MAGDMSGRRLLPQQPQTQAISFAPPSYVRQESGQRSFVFVDEHNRHKRLKVMRACEGCRRRKIKCDGATTNAWPCSSCGRLKLQCIPPAIDGETGEDEGRSAEPEAQEELPTYNHHNGIYSGNNSQTPARHESSSLNSTPQRSEIVGSSGDEKAFSQAALFNDQSHSQGSLNMLAYSNPSLPYQNHDAFPTPPTRAVSDTGESWQSDHSGPDFTEAMGQLKIDDAGLAPYIRQQRKPDMVEAPAQGDVDDIQHSIPYFPVGPDLTIQIPAEYMPSEIQAVHYFDIFFTHIHPYVPVLNKHQFYNQWYSDRESISPLILEAIFACAGRLSDDPTQGLKWLALAGRHADSFMDVPRLSTIQALLIILKARETAPKKGYYFRSWMTIEAIVTIAKEYGMAEHLEMHQNGQSCSLSPSECIIQTRVWQTIFVCELMIGAPQGRMDMSVDPETVDFSPILPVHGVDKSEFTLSRNFLAIASVVRNVRNMTIVHARLRKNKNWALDPTFVTLEPSFIASYNALPDDLQVTYSTNGQLRVATHFVGNVHCYHHLSIIMLHRPQLAVTDTFAASGEWRRHMMRCYTAAKELCRLQETLLQDFGLRGLLCMQRGISFAIYCVLTCTVLHLVAITSPDPELNRDAKEYFTRHMRILEKCTTSWLMPEMQTQIESLREAFSADISKPFKMKPSFPYNQTPPPQPHTALDSLHYQQESASMPAMSGPMSNPSYINAPITPPVSTESYSVQETSPHETHWTIPNQHTRPPEQQQTQGFDISSWNPSRIFDQWNIAFGGANPTPPDHTVINPTPLRAPTILHQTSSPQPNHLTQQPTPQQQSEAYITSASTVSSPPAIGPTFVSPTMWQESVASVYGQGMKRNWGDYGGSGILDGMGVNVKRSR